MRGSANGWAEKLMSFAAKEVKIKSVLQAKSTYCMSCFQLSKGIYKMTSIIAKFWWSGCLDKRSMHWLAWDKIVVPKGQGGMGFRDMAAFNISLLGKQGWRLITSPDSLCARVLSARYYHNKSFMEATAPRTASRTWRAILAGREALERGIIKRVGTGESISIWDDNWIPNSGTLQPLFRPADATVEKVSELIRNNQWDLQKLSANKFCQLDIERILQIPLSSRAGDDWVAWAHEKSGLYQLDQPTVCWFRMLARNKVGRVSLLPTVRLICGNACGV
jgi:hypothetical protein